MEKQFLLYIDFLGFSRKVRQSSFVETWGHYQKIMKVVEVSVMKVGLKNQVNYDFVSDSLFFWPMDDDPFEDGFAKLVILGTHVLNNCVRERLSPRGALVYDEFYINDFEHPLFIKNCNPNDGIISKKVHTILGKGIVRAADWEKDQKWAGISLSPDDYMTLGNEAPKLLQGALERHLLVEHNVPTKSSGLLLTLAFPFVLDSAAAIATVKGHFEHTVASSTDSDAGQYAMETLRFIDNQLRTGVNVYGG